jgi:hypothetical protein
MYNKESCRRCGEILVPDIICNNCSEVVLWICSSCTNVAEHVHIHNENKNSKSTELRALDIQYIYKYCLYLSHLFSYIS